MLLVQQLLTHAYPHNISLTIYIYFNIYLQKFLFTIV